VAEVKMNTILVVKNVGGSIANYGKSFSESQYYDYGQVLEDLGWMGKYDDIDDKEVMSSIQNDFWRMNQREEEEWRKFLKGMSQEPLAQEDICKVEGENMSLSNLCNKLLSLQGEEFRLWLATYFMWLWF
jgi:hypothetical protein